MGPCLTNIDRKDPSGGKPCTAESSMFPVIVVIRRQNEIRLVNSGIVVNCMVIVQDSFKTIIVYLLFLNSL